MTLSLKILSLSDGPGRHSIVENSMPNTFIIFDYFFRDIGRALLCDFREDPVRLGEAGAVPSSLVAN